MFDRHFDQIANDRFDIAADITDFGEFGGFDFDERRIGEFGQTTRDFGFTDAGRADHQNIFRRDFIAQLFVELHAAPAIAQRDGDGALGLILADDMLIEFVTISRGVMIMRSLRCLVSDVGLVIKGL